ncbi:MAG: hypothetical protein ABWZ52_09165 [Acidimicrobiales bacterium]
MIHTTGITLAEGSRGDQVRRLTRLAIAACALAIGSWAAIAATIPAGGAEVAISDGTSNT